MSEQLTAGYKALFGDETGDEFGIIREISLTYSGDNEEVSGLNDVENSIIRVKNLPVDVGVELTISGIKDKALAGHDAFDTAMKQRTADSTITVIDPNGTDYVTYTGHSNTYDPESVNRDEATAKFSLTFTANDTTEGTIA